MGRLGHISCAFIGLLLVAAPPGAAGTESPSPTGQTADPLAGLPEAVREQIASLRARVERDPDDDETRRRLAIALHAAEQKEDAVAQFEILVQHQPDDPRRLLDLGLAYGSISRFAEAEATYRRLLGIAPNHAIALHNLGNLAFKRGENEAAIELYRKAVAAKPDYILAWLHLGDVLEAAERFKEAYRTYEKVINDLEPRTTEETAAYDDALYNLAALDIRFGATDRARVMLEELLRANPEHASAHYAYGQILLQAGRTAEAEREFEIHARLLAQRKPTGPMAHGD